MITNLEIMFFYVAPTSLKHHKVAVDRTILCRTKSEQNKHWKFESFLG